MQPVACSVTAEEDVPELDDVETVLETALETILSEYSEETLETLPNVSTVSREQAVRNANPITNANDKHIFFIVHL